MQKNSSKVSRRNKTITVILVIALVAAVAGGIIIYKKYTNLKNNPNVSQQAADNRAKAVKDKVGKLIDVPQDETPTLATVSDKEKLKDQPFFKDAQNSDTILIFPQAKKAYIYRENENRLINVGPIAITSDQQGTSTDKSTNTSQ